MEENSVFGRCVFVSMTSEVADDYKWVSSVLSTYCCSAETGKGEVENEAENDNI